MPHRIAEIELGLLVATDATELDPDHWDGWRQRGNALAQMAYNTQQPAFATLELPTPASERALQWLAEAERMYAKALSIDTDVTGRHAIAVAELVEKVSGVALNAAKVHLNAAFAAAEKAQTYDEQFAEGAMAAERECLRVLTELEITVEGAREARALLIEVRAALSKVWAEEGSPERAQARAAGYGLLYFDGSPPTHRRVKPGDDWVTVLQAVGETQAHAMVARAVRRQQGVDPFAVGPDAEGRVSSRLISDELTTAAQPATADEPSPWDLP